MVGKEEKLLWEAILPIASLIQVREGCSYTSSEYKSRPLQVSYCNSCCNKVDRLSLLGEVWKISRCTKVLTFPQDIYVYRN